MKTIDRRALFTESASEGKQALMQEIATVERDITIYPYGGILSHQDPTLATRGGADSYKIYDDIERDCHAWAVLEKRRKVVLAREYEIDPAGETSADVAASELIHEILEDHVDRLSRNLLEAILKGFSVVEVMWEKVDNQIIPAEFRGRDPRRFVFSEDGKLRLKTRESMVSGIELPEKKFIIHRFEDKYNNPYGLGLGTRLFWPVWFKRQGISFWLQFCDKFGSPTVLGKYPPGTGKPDQNLLLSACEAVSHAAGMIIPEGMMMEFLEAQRSGSINTYETLCRYMDEQISEAVLGETGSTNQSGSGGSRARDAVGNEVRLEIAKSDSDSLSETLNSTIIRWIVDFNMPGAGYPKIWRTFVPPEETRFLAYRDAVLMKMGLKMPVKYFYDKYQIPIPEKGDEIMELPQEMQGSGGALEGGEGSQFAEGMRQLAEGERKIAKQNLAVQDAFEKGAIDLAANFKNLIGGRVEELLALLEESKDLKTFQKRLAGLLKGPPPQELVEAVSRASFAAQAMGRGKPRP